MRGLAKLKYLFICFALGALQVLAFAPFEIWPISFLSLAAYFFMLRSLTANRAFKAGLAYGYGLYGFGVSWVYVSLSTYGGMPFWMGGIAIFGFAGILALFIATAAFVSVKFFDRKFILLITPFVWSIFEWLKSWVLTGFPWLDIGYTQTPSWLFSWAPLGGVYLVGFMVCVASILIVGSVNAILNSEKRLFALALGGVSLLFIGSFFLDQYSWSEPVGEPQKIGIVQANVPINNKWQSSVRSELISNYQNLSHKLAHEYQVDLLVLPETALPLYQQQTDLNFWRNMTPPNTALLTGILDSPSTSGGARESYNAAILSCDGSTQIYRKTHLVPFGEYLPLRFLFNWVLEYLELPMSDFSSWSGEQSLACGDIVNISEDAWFGDSLAPHQRRQMAQMRARELSRPMVRSANSGPSLFINEKGELLEQTAQFVEATLVRNVQPHDGDSPFKRYGNWIIWFSMFVSLLVGLISRRKT